MDVFSTKKRSWIMSRIKSCNTKFEVEFLKLLSHKLYKKGYRYRKHYSRLPGKPDIVFIKQRVAIFLDGDFWHGYKFKKGSSKLPKKYWLEKIEKNIERDKIVNRKLGRLEWKVLRFWENQIKNNSEKAIIKIENFLKNNS